MIAKTLFILILACYSLSTTSQTDAIQLIDKSIAYHDPYNVWDTLEAELYFLIERPNKSNLSRQISFNNKRVFFSMLAPYPEGTLLYQVTNKQIDITWNYKHTIPKAMQEEYNISNERALMYRDYYTYLYGMPMKLKDQGAIIHPDVERVNFFGYEYDRIKVSYAPEVGKDTWYFYFNPYSYALEAYQFFHDQSKNDGEYILFDEIIEINKIKMPKIRKWYTNKGDRYLGADILQ